MGSLDKQKTGSSSGGTIDADVMEYKGGWAANTNTPTLSDSDTDVHGNIYIVTADGSTDFGAGAISFEAGDFVVNNGTVWEKVDSTKTAAQIKTAVDSQLTGDTVGTSDSQTLTNKTIDGNNNTITNVGGGFWSDVVTLASDYSILNQGTYTDVTGLNISLEANSTYFLKYIVGGYYENTGDNPQCRTTIDYSGTSFLANFSDGSDGIMPNAFGVDITLLNSTSVRFVELIAFIQTDTSGTLKFQVKQATPSTNDSSYIVKDSSIYYKKIS